MSERFLSAAPRWLAFGSLLLPLAVPGAPVAAEVIVAVEARAAEDFKEGRHVVPFDLASGPPTVRLLLTGPQAEIAGRLFAGPGIRLEAESLGPDAGIEEWIPTLDGREMSLGDWPGEIAAGRHTVAASAIAEDGTRHESASLAFTYDDDPPEIRWGWADGSTLGSTREVESAGGEGAPHGAQAPPLLWTSAEDHWLPMAHRRWRFHAVKPFLMLHPHKGKSRWGVRDDQERDRRYRKEKQRRRRVSFEEPRILLRPEKGGTVRLEGPGASLDSGRAFEIRASDPTSRVEKMHFQVLTRTGVGGRAGATQLLVVEAIDAVGNRSRVEWPLETSGAR